jgi:hypothetical protein
LEIFLKGWVATYCLPNSPKIDNAIEFKAIKFNTAGFFGLFINLLGYYKLIVYQNSPKIDNAIEEQKKSKRPDLNRSRLLQFQRLAIEPILTLSKNIINLIKIGGSLSPQIPRYFVDFDQNIFSAKAD